MLAASFPRRTQMAYILSLGVSTDHGGAASRQNGAVCIVCTLCVTLCVLLPPFVSAACGGGGGGSAPPSDFSA